MDKHKLKQYMTTKSTLQKIPNEILHRSEEEKQLWTWELSKDKLHKSNRGINENYERIKHVQLSELTKL
jgi:hypothetical protein